MKLYTWAQDGITSTDDIREMFTYVFGDYDFEAFDEEDIERDGGITVTNRVTGKTEFWHIDNIEAFCGRNFNDNATLLAITEGD